MMSSENKVKDLLAQTQSLFDQNDFISAQSVLNDLLLLEPTNCHALNLLGIAHEQCGNLLVALQFFDQALEQDAYRYPVWNNRGNVLERLGRFDDAKQSYLAALELNPAYEMARYNFATLALRMGDLKQGWPAFEGRWAHQSISGNRLLSEKTLWLGQESLAGKTLLIWLEQGSGDVLQFIRYAPLLAKQQSCSVIAMIIPEMHSLLAHSFAEFENVTLVTPAEGMPEHDFHCPLMSLPLACGTDCVDKIPAPIPYLFCESKKRLAWGERLAQDFANKRRLRIGLVWAGGERPHQPELKSLNERRNMPLALLALLDHLDLDLISLQKGKAAEQELQSLIDQGLQGISIKNYGQHLHDFGDTAALIDNLDLVITVDTSVAHLAGAMSKPVWILNRFDACWRWLYGQEPERTDSPWYPTARLFKQKTRGDWAGVIDEVKAALQVELASYNA